MLGQIVIVGIGQAAVQAIDTLRRKGFTGKLIVIGAEPWAAYQRPPLSKKYLAGTMDRERLAIRPAHFYTDHAVDLRLGRRVEEISRRDQRVRLDDDTWICYDALLLATGSRPRALDVPGIDLAGVHSLRTIQDADGMRAGLSRARRAVVVGGGYIGLEVAATARELGLDITIVEMSDRILNRVTCPQVSAFFHAEHTRRGVCILVNSQVRRLLGSAGRVAGVMTADGTIHPADLVILGIGVVAADDLAAQAGLQCSNGIAVDENCRTSDPAIYAAGDCTSHPNLHYGRRVRLESVDNAFEQGNSAALNLLGTITAHDKVPWFWSDQYDLKLIIVGLAHDHDRVVVRGSAASRSFSACYLRAGELVAVDTVNQPRDQMAARKLVAARARPDLDKLANPQIALRDCA